MIRKKMHPVDCYRKYNLQKAYFSIKSRETQFLIISFSTITSFSSADGFTIPATSAVVFGFTVTPSLVCSTYAIRPSGK